MITSNLFILRRDPVIQLGAHLAAGIFALALLTGMAFPKDPPVAAPAPVAPAHFASLSGSPAPLAPAATVAAVGSR